MTERDDNFKPGDEIPSFTQEEISQLVEFTEIVFNAVTDNHLFNKRNVINRLRQEIETGVPLSSAAVGEVSILIQGMKIGADVIRSQGNYSKAFATVEALEGGKFLIGQIELGELCALGHGEELLLGALSQAIKQQPFPNEQIPLPDQTEQYLSIRRRAKKLHTLFDEDPSGSTIIDDTLQELGDPSSDLSNHKQLDLTHQDFVLCGMRKTAEFYKNVYLLGCSANLGPKPKT